MRKPKPMPPEELRIYFLRQLEAKKMPLEDINEGCTMSIGGYEQYQFECEIVNHPFYFQYRKGIQYILQFQIKYHLGSDAFLNCEVCLSTDADTYAFITKMIDDVHQFIQLTEMQRLMRDRWNQIASDKKMPITDVRKQLIDTFLAENK